MGVADSGSLKEARLPWFHAPGPTSSEAKHAFPAGARIETHLYNT